MITEEEWEWQHYERHNEAALRFHDKITNRDTAPCKAERRRLRPWDPAKRRALLASRRVPMADDCLGVSPGTEYRLSCRCEHCCKARSAAMIGVVRGPNQPSEPDDVAVGRALAGEKLYLRPVERREVVLAATRQGESAKMIAGRMGISSRQVVRMRQQLKREGRL